jgi:hypothetical protein
MKKPTGASAYALTDLFFIDTVFGPGNSGMVVQKAIKLPWNAAVSPVSSTQRTIHEGEYLFAQIITSSNVTTQPQGLIVVVELIVLE